MKKSLNLTVTLAAISLLVSACDIDESMRKQAKNPAEVAARALAAQHGCMGCHSVSSTVMGPAWRLVAERYKNVPEAKKLLIEKIEQGGRGSWNHMTGGEEMPGYAGDLTDDELSTLVDYILGL